MVNDYGSEFSDIADLTVFSKFIYRDVHARLLSSVFIVPKREAAVVCKGRNDNQRHKKT